MQVKDRESLKLISPVRGLFGDLYYLFFQVKLNSIREEIMHSPIDNGFFFLLFFFLSEKAVTENKK